MYCRSIIIVDSSYYFVVMTIKFHFFIETPGAQAWKLYLRCVNGLERYINPVFYCCIIGVTNLDEYSLCRDVEEDFKKDGGTLGRSTLKKV